MNEVKITNKRHQMISSENLDNSTCIRRKKSIASIKGISNSNQFNKSVTIIKPPSLMTGGVRFLDKVIFPSTIKNSISALRNNSVALYGFSASQADAMCFIREIGKDYKCITIGGLNQRIDLSFTIYEHPQKVNAFKLLHAISKLTEDVTLKKIIPRNKCRDKDYSEALLEKWIAYLHKNKHKVDIFSYVNARNQSMQEKEMLIKKLIFKNSNSNINIDSLSEFIIKNKLFDCKNSTEALLYLESLDLHPDLSRMDIYGVFELIQGHFFRNSSKLGIDFFRENKIDIVSSWNTPTNIHNENLPAQDINIRQCIYNEKIKVSEINKKPFIYNERRRLNEKEIREPITYSEIRHMSRKHKSDINGITRVFLNGDDIEFASGIVKGKWIKHDKSKIIASNK